MKTPAENLRSQLDRMWKEAALHPELKTGGDLRLTEEMMNTAARARMMGEKRKALRAPRSTLSLQELVKRK